MPHKYLTGRSRRSQFSSWGTSGSKLDMNNLVPYVMLVSPGSLLQSATHISVAASKIPASSPSPSAVYPLLSSPSEAYSGDAFSVSSTGSRTPACLSKPLNCAEEWLCQALERGLGASGLSIRGDVCSDSGLAPKEWEATCSTPDPHRKDVGRWRRVFMSVFIMRSVDSCCHDRLTRELAPLKYHR